MKSIEFANAVIDLLDGTTAVARIFNIKPPSVCEWRWRGIPDDRLAYLEAEFPATIKKARQKVVRDARVRLA